MKKEDLEEWISLFDIISRIFSLPLIIAFMMDYYWKVPIIYTLTIELISIRFFITYILKFDKENSNGDTKE